MASGGAVSTPELAVGLRLQHQLMLSSQLGHFLGVCLAGLRGQCQVRVYILGVIFLSIFYSLSRALAQSQ